ncbi:MAG: hypothetical protein WDO70_02575 [Alphaproteobacteria bacterium]
MNRKNALILSLALAATAACSKAEDAICDRIPEGTFDGVPLSKRGAYVGAPPVLLGNENESYVTAQPGQEPMLVEMTEYVAQQRLEEREIGASEQGHFDMYENRYRGNGRPVQNGLYKLEDQGPLGFSTLSSGELRIMFPTAPASQACPEFEKLPSETKVLLFIDTCRDDEIYAIATKKEVLGFFPPISPHDMSPIPGTCAAIGPQRPNPLVCKFSDLAL